MLLSGRSMSLEVVIPFLSGAAWTVILSCVITLVQIDPILDYLLTEGSIAYTVAYSFLRAAVIEESAKLFVALDTPYRCDVLFSAITGALGFAAGENLEYLFSRSASIPQLLARLITANVVHVGCTALIVLVGLRFQSRLCWIVAFSLGTLFHGLYDCFVMSTVPVAAIAVVQTLVLVVASLTVLSEVAV